MDEVNKFLGEFGQNNEGVEQETVQETEVSTEQGTEAVTTETQTEEKLPFHKDPKVQRYIEKQLDKRMAEFQPSRTEQFQKDTTQDNPYQSYAEKLLGNDTAENKAKSQILAQTLLDIEKRASDTSYNRFAEESKQAQQEEMESINELQDGIDRIEETFNVDLSSNSPTSKKTRNEFLDFLGRISPKDQYGEIKEYADIDYAFEEFSKRNKPELNTQAKQIASRSMSSSTANASGTPTRRITAGNLRSVLGLE